MFCRYCEWNRWGCDYLHSIKPVLVEAWLRSLPFADGKAKIRNIMSAVFSHGIRYELTDKNPIKAVRQSAGRAKVSMLLDVGDLPVV
jgi:integrase